MKLEIPRVSLIIGLFLAAEAIVFYYFSQANDHNRATFLFAGTIIGGAFALYVFLREIEDERVKAASKLIERWNAPDRYELKRVLKRIMDEKLDPATLMRKTKNEEQTPEVLDERIKVTAVLNFFKEMAISVKDRSVNENKLYEFFCDVLDHTFSKLNGYIENERRIDNVPRYFCEMENLVRRWRER